MNIKAIETVYRGYRFRSRLEARWAVFFDALGLEWEYEPEGFDLTDAYLDHLIALREEQEEENRVTQEHNKRILSAMKHRVATDLTEWDLSELAGAVRTHQGKSDWDSWEQPVHMEDVWRLPRELWPLWEPRIVNVPELDTSLLLRYLPDFYLRDLDQWVEIKPYKNPEPWTDDVRHEIFPKRLIVLFGTPGAVSANDMGSPSYAGCVIEDTPYFLCECPVCGALGFQYCGRAERNKHLPGCPIDPNDKIYLADSPRIKRAEIRARSARFEHGETPRL